MHSPPRPLVDYECFLIGTRITGPAGQRSAAAWEGHCLSLAIGGNCPARVGPVGRVSLEDGQPTTVARLLLRHWLNTWLGTARLRAYVRKSHTRLVGNRPQGRLAAQSSSSSLFQKRLCNQTPPKILNFQPQDCFWCSRPPQKEPFWRPFRFMLPSRGALRLKIEEFGGVWLQSPFVEEILHHFSRGPGQ